MTRNELFHIWAPRGGLWSDWVKPVLFAAWSSRREAIQALPVRTVGSPALADGTAGLVIDLGGPAGVWTGMAMAQHGFRPVPLYNAAPGPGASISMVDIWPIVDALRSAAPMLKELNLPAYAPPAFLLDSRRGIAQGAAMPGRFDNRSVSFPTDFPGARFLMNRGIRTILLIQEEAHLQPLADLAHTLLRWQESGIAIRTIGKSIEGDAVRITVRRPMWYRGLFYRLATTMGLRRNRLGGYGGTLPDPSGGG